MKKYWTDVNKGYWHISQVISPIGWKTAMRILDKLALFNYNVFRNLIQDLIAGRHVMEWNPGQTVMACDR
ncbi:MAG: hypothetical protein JW902_09945 [Syntrophaceae bacterium]|nr:hypothetical protein [Syntrophaceae bacterium]